MNYSIDTAKKLIHARLMGPISSKDLLKKIVILRSDKYFQNGFNIIFDIREAQVPQGYTELSHIAEFVKVTSVAKNTFRVAILVQNEEQTRSANLYILLVGHKHVQICQSIKKANEWVSQVLTQPTIQKVEVNEL